MDLPSVFLSTDIEIKKFSNSDFLIINNRFNHYLKISDNVFKILSILDGKTKTISQICLEYNSKYSQEITDAEIQAVVSELHPYGVFNNALPTVIKKNEPSYLKLTFTIFNQGVVNFLTRYLTWLFKAKLFVILSVLSFLIITFFLIKLSQRGIETLPSTTFTITLYFIIMLVITLFHELGHAAAARYFNAKTGKIGLGFYLLSPTFFADVSDIWRLTKNQRNIVNFGGIYFELLFTAIFILFLEFFPNDELLIIPISFTVLCLYNLNPFLRTDGYWILSDAIGIPNLQKQSGQKIVGAFYALKNRTSFVWNKNSVFLILYGIISYGWVISFLSYILIFDNGIFLSFTSDIVDVFEKLFSEGVLQIEKLVNCIMTLVTVYIILIYVRVAYHNIVSKKIISK